jgi:Peptidase family M23
MGAAWPARSRVVASTAVVVAVLTLPAVAVAVPDFETPFPCSQRWTGSTRPTHSPSPRAIDFNRRGDLGDLVLASAPGVVSRAVNLGNRSYGRFVQVDHGGGESSLYAHLSATWVKAGQRVDQGAVLGRVGATGSATGPHLHFEERVGSRLRRPLFHQHKYAYGTGRSRNCSDVPVVGDWDGSGVDQLGVFRRTARSGFRLLMPDGTTKVIAYGRAEDVAAVGDWNGDELTDVGVWLPRTQTFLLRHGPGTVERVRLGQAGDVPVTGDWDGDQVTDVGVWRPATHTFRLLLQSGSVRAVQLGVVGSQPVTGDWNADGVTELGVFNAGKGVFVLREVAVDGSVSLETVPFGDAGSLPVVGDWDGDGADDLGVWSRATATFSRRTPAGVTRTRFGLPRR